MGCKNILEIQNDRLDAWSLSSKNGRRALLRLYITKLQCSALTFYSSKDVFARAIEV